MCVFAAVCMHHEGIELDPKRGTQVAPGPELQTAPIVAPSHGSRELVKRSAGPRASAARAFGFMASTPSIQRGHSLDWGLSKSVRVAVPFVLAVRRRATCKRIHATVMALVGSEL